jgi:hypothetical protein
MTDANTEVLTEEEDSADTVFQDLSLEQQVDLLSASLTEFLDKMEQRGLAPEVTHCVLISVMATRMAQQGCREEFEHYLTEALEEPWPTVNYH